MVLQEIHTHYTDKGCMWKGTSHQYSPSLCFFFCLKETLRHLKEPSWASASLWSTCHSLIGQHSIIEATHRAVIHQVPANLCFLRPREITPKLFQRRWKRREEAESHSKLSSGLKSLSWEQRLDRYTGREMGPAWERSSYHILGGGLLHPKPPGLWHMRVLTTETKTSGERKQWSRQLK